jgi:hypothetical protein
LDVAGNAVVSWLSRSCGGSSCVATSRLPAGQTRWTPPQVLARGSGDWPAVGRDRRGRPLVVWPHRSKGDWSIHASSFSGGRWARPWRLASLAHGHSPAGLKLATNDGGTAALIWTNVPAVSRGQTFVEGSVRLRKGAWLQTWILSAADADSPSVAIDKVGNVVAVWYRFGNPPIIETAIRPAGSYRWSRPRVLGQGRSPSVAVDDRGTFVAAWSASTGVEVRMRRADSRTWGPTQVVGTTPHTRLSLAVGRGGMVGLAWEKAERQVPGRFIEATRLRPADGKWESPRVISRSFAINPAIAVDQRGTIFVIWEYFPGAGSTVEAVVRRATDSDWPAPVQLAPTAAIQRNPTQVVPRGKGRALAAWMSRWGPGSVEIAEFDGR